MSKRKTPGYEIDDEFIAHIDFLRNDYDNDCRPSSSKNRAFRSFLRY